MKNGSGAANAKLVRLFATFNWRTEEYVDDGDWRCEHTCYCDRIAIRSRSQLGMRVRWALHWVSCSFARLSEYQGNAVRAMHDHPCPSDHDHEAHTCWRIVT